MVKEDILASPRVLNILMIEDNEADMTITQIAFEESEYKNNIYFITDGEQAIDFIHGRKAFADRHLPHPDLILLDINLPRYSGFEVLKEIKSNPDFSRIPVIMLTSSSHPQDIHKSYAAGACGYIQKPVDFQDLADIIGKFNSYWHSVSKLPQ